MKCRILYITITGIRKNIVEDQSVRYRCYNFCLGLEEMGHLSAYIHYDDFKMGMIDCFDVFVFHRPKFDNKIEMIISRLVAAKKLFFADYDDLIVGEQNYTYYPRFTLGLNTEHEARSYYRNNSQALNCFSDIIVSTDELKNEILKITNKNIHVLYNTISPELLTLSHIYNAKPKIQRYFNIGFFAGSLMHKISFRAIERALSQMLNEYSDVRVFLVGGIFTEFSVSSHKNCVLINRLNYNDYISILSRMNLNLSPLILDNFSKCKSALKIFEAGILNVPTLANKTTDCQRLEKVTEGFVEEDGNDWYKIINKTYTKYKSNRKVNLIDLSKENCSIIPELNKLLAIIYQ